MISVLFASGLQLSNAVEQRFGWLLLALAVVLACVYVIVERRTETKGVAMIEAGGTNINYGNQEVGINKGIINREVVPRAALYGVSENVPDGDTFLSSYKIDLEGRPQALIALVESKKVVELDLEEDRDYSAGFAVATGENPEGFPICETPNPAPGSYILKVRLSEPVAGLKPRLGLPMQGAK